MVSDVDDPRHPSTRGETARARGSAAVAAPPAPPPAAYPEDHPAGRQEGHPEATRPPVPSPPVGSEPTAAASKAPARSSPWRDRWAEFLVPAELYLLGAILLTVRIGLHPANA